MSAIVTTVLKGTLGILIKKGRKVAVEKLKDGDVTNEKLKNWIVDEIDNVNSKLDAMAKKDLGASISFFREGLVFLNNAMETNTYGIGSLNESPVEVGGRVENVKEENREKSSKKVNPEASKEESSLSKLFRSIASQVKGFWDQGSKVEKGLEAASQMTEEPERSSGAEENELSFKGKLTKMNLNSVDEIEEAILDAKKRFDDARRKATEAFNNEGLTPLDRILAMGVRLMAIILEKVDNPESASDACISGLNKLHSMRFVTENFNVELEKGIKSKFTRDERRQIISFVCQINRTIYDFALLVSTKEVFSFWPCVEIANERVDPLRDSRVANMLRELDMGDFCLPWSFGQEGEQRDQRLASVNSIAIDTLGQFLVVDDWCNCVKVFDASGKFLKSFNPFTKSGRSVAAKRFVKSRRHVGGNPFANTGRLVVVTTDQDDNIYVLKNDKSQNAAEAFLRVLNNSAQFLDYFEIGFTLQAMTVKVMASRLVLVPVYFDVGYGQTDPCNELINDYVVLKNTKGERIGFLSEETLKQIKDIATTDDLIMILDRTSTVFVFTDACVSDEDRPVLQLLKKFPVRGKASAITFHPKSKHVIFVSEIKDHRWQLLFYSKEGKFERSIDLDVEQGYDITGAAVTTDGRVCIAASNPGEGKGKVLVV